MAFLVLSRFNLIKFCILMFVLPARVKKLIKKDESVKNVSKEATVAIVKATELFLASLAKAAAKKCTERGRKTLSPNDIGTFISCSQFAEKTHFVCVLAALAARHSEQFEFLRDDFKPTEERYV